MKIEIFIDERKTRKSSEFKWGLYILRDEAETRQHTLFDTETYCDHDVARQEARAAASYLFPGIEVLGEYPAPSMIEGDLRTT